MEEIYNPRIVADELAANKVPASLPRLPDAGPKAGAVYKNVQVLGDESVGNFTRLMASITNWVAPTQGCAYCHDVNNMAADSVYTKVVARRMIQMVQHVNSGLEDAMSPRRASLATPAIAASRCQPMSGSTIPGRHRPAAWPRRRLGRTIRRR